MIYNHIENNTESQLHFDKNKDKFSNQCRLVYQLLLKGERLTTKKALIEYGIGDLRRRIKDLKDFWGVNIQSEYTESRYKEYFLEKKPLGKVAQ